MDLVNSNEATVEVSSRKFEYCTNVVAVNNYTETPLFQAMKPFFLSMKIVGLYFCKTYKGPEDENIKPKCRVTCSFVFSTIILFINWLNLLRLLSSLTTDFEFGTTVFMKIVMTVWVLLCTINTTSCWLGCYRVEGLPQFFIEWHQVQSEFVEITNCLR